MDQQSKMIDREDTQGTQGNPHKEKFGLQSQYIAGLFNLWNIDILDWLFLCACMCVCFGGRCPVQWRMFSSISGL